MTMDDIDESDVEHLNMLYPKLVYRAMKSHDPITNIKEISETRKMYTAVYFNQENETAWRAYIDVDNYGGYDESPSIHFSKCYPNSSYESMEKWSALATGRLSGPQDVHSWHSIMKVFNTSYELYQNDIQDKIDAQD